MHEDRIGSALERFALPLLALLLALVAVLQFGWLEQLAQREADSRRAALEVLRQGLRADLDNAVAAELAALRSTVPANAVAQPRALRWSGGGLASQALWLGDSNGTAQPTPGRLRAGETGLQPAGWVDLVQAIPALMRFTRSGRRSTAGEWIELPLALHWPQRAQPVPGRLLVVLPRQGLQAFLDARLQERAPAADLGRLRLLLREADVDDSQRVPSAERFADQPLAGRWSLDLAFVDGSAAELARALHRRNLLAASAVLLLLALSAGLILIGLRRARRDALRRLALAAAASHELRTPLAVIQSAAANLADGVTRDAERVRAYGEMMRDAAVRLHRLVDGTLAAAFAARRVAMDGAATPASLERAIETVRSDLSGLGAPQRIDASEAAEQAPPLRLPQSDLDLMLANLLGNALRYATAYGRVRLDWRMRRRSLQLSVRNAALELDATERGRIGQPFQRGRQARALNPDGSGLGLSLVEALAARHGGRLDIRFEGGDIVVTLSLPLMRGYRR